MQVLSALPGGVDALLGFSPPKVLLLPGSPGLRLGLHASLGTAAVRPYYHVGGDGGTGTWRGLGTDGAAGAGLLPVTVDAAQFGGSAEGRLVANGEPRYWILLRESGAGTIDSAELDAVDR